MTLLPFSAFSEDEPSNEISRVVRNYIKYEENKDLSALTLCLDKNAQLYLFDDRNQIEATPFREIIENIRNNPLNSPDCTIFKDNGKCYIESTEIFDSISYVRIRIERVLTGGIECLKFKYLTLLNSKYGWQIVSVLVLNSKYQKNSEKRRTFKTWETDSGILQIWQISE